MPQRCQQSEPFGRIKQTPQLETHVVSELIFVKRHKMNQKAINSRATSNDNIASIDCLNNYHVLASYAIKWLFLETWDSGSTSECV